MRAHSLQIPLREISLNEIASALNKAYHDYVVPIRFDHTSLSRLILTDDIDLSRSSVTRVSGETAAVSLIACRGRRMRLVALGCLPEYRLRGFSRRLLLDGTEMARQDGFVSIVLEVFESNNRAISLYRSAGFVPRRRLLGYTRKSVDPQFGDPAGLRPLHQPEMLYLLRTCDFECAPWQAEPMSIARDASRCAGWDLGGKAFAIVSPARDDAVTLRYFMVAKEHRGLGLGRQLLESVPLAMPGRRWVIPPLVPEGAGSNALEAAGWQVSTLAQQEMILTL